MPKNNSTTLDQMQEQMEAQQEQAQQAAQQQAQEQEQKPTEKYTPKENEKHLYHVRLEKERYNSKTGKKESVPFIQMFSEGEFKRLTNKPGENLPSNAQMLGYTVVEVLWNPKENI